MSLTVSVNGQQTMVDTDEVMSMQQLQDDGLRIILALDANMQDAVRRSTQPVVHETARLITLGVWKAILGSMMADVRKGLPHKERMVAKKLTADIVNGLAIGPTTRREIEDGDGADEKAPD